MKRWLESKHWVATRNCTFVAKYYNTRTLKQSKDLINEICGKVLIIHCGMCRYYISYVRIYKSGYL